MPGKRSAAWCATDCPPAAREQSYLDWQEVEKEREGISALDSDADGEPRKLRWDVSSTSKRQTVSQSLNLGNLSISITTYAVKPLDMKSRP